jgi:hypothetical protein
MRVRFEVNSTDSFELDVPTVFPDMQIVRSGHGGAEGPLYQVASVRLQTSIGAFRSAREEVESIVAFVQPRGTVGIL